jgi:hypothetical protein
VPTASIFSTAFIGASAAGVSMSNLVVCVCARQSAKRWRPIARRPRALGSLLFSFYLRVSAARFAADRRECFAKRFPFSLQAIKLAAIRLQFLYRTENE